MQTLLEIQVPSFTNPMVSYKVHKSVKDGTWVCECKGWKYSQGTPKSCIHLRSLARDLWLSGVVLPSMN